jgi:hypothetical protein
LNGRRKIPGFVNSPNRYNLSGIDGIFVELMKKVLLSVSFICYLALSCGIVVNLHYCMNRLASTELFGAKKKTCGKCGMPATGKHGCCHDEVKLIKLHDDQQKATGFQLVEPSISVAILPSVFLLSPFYNVADHSSQISHSPPLLTEETIYLQNGVFRI